MYKVLLRKNDTGEERLYESNSDWEEISEYMWTEGGYACDCNRHDFFHAAGGEEPEDDCPCGEEAYAAIYAELPNGTQILLDSDEDDLPVMETIH